MKILVDVMPEKISDCPYANRIPMKGQPTFVCEMDQDREVCRGVSKCPVLISYDEFKRRKYDQNCHSPVAERNYFVEEIEKYHMTDPLEILNWYRNLYYQEGYPSEQRIMAEAINDLFMRYKDIFRRESEAG